jgi:hypothetical protein
MNTITGRSGLFGLVHVGEDIYKVQLEVATECDRLRTLNAELTQALQDIFKWANDNGRVFSFKADSDGGIVSRARAALEKAKQSDYHDRPASTITGQLTKAECEKL